MSAAAHSKTITGEPMLIGKRWVFPNGMSIPAARGGIDDGAPDPATQPAEWTAAAIYAQSLADAPPRTFTAAEHQAELSRVAAREAAEAERKARTKLLDELGLTADDVGGAKDLIAAARTAEDAAKTQAQRDAEAAAAAARAAAADREAAANDKRDAAVLVGLARAHVTDDKVLDDLAVLVSAKLDGDPTPENVDAAVAKVKETVPSLFGEQSNDGGGSGSGGGYYVPPTHKGGHGDAQTLAERGRQRALKAQGKKDPEKQSA